LPRNTKIRVPWLFLQKDFLIRAEKMILVFIGHFFRIFYSNPKNNA